MPDPTEPPKSAYGSLLGGELLPVVVFAGAYKVWGMLVATGALMLLVTGKIGWRLLRRQRVEPMLWATGAIVDIFGGATLWLQDEAYIKWKPTVVYWLMAAVLGGFHVLVGKNLLESAAGGKLSLPPEVWRRVLAAWVAFLASLGGLNLYVATYYSNDTWVWSKFGAIGLLCLFVLLQSVWLGKYIEDR